MWYFMHEVDPITVRHVLLIVWCGLLLVCRSFVVKAHLSAVEWIDVVLGHSLLRAIPL